MRLVAGHRKVKALHRSLHHLHRVTGGHSQHPLHLYTQSAGPGLVGLEAYQQLSQNGSGSQPLPVSIWHSLNHRDQVQNMHMTQSGSRYSYEGFLKREWSFLTLKRKVLEDTLSFAVRSWGCPNRITSTSLPPVGNTIAKGQNPYREEQNQRG